MRIREGLLRWGVFLVVLGGAAVAVDQGWIAGAQASRAWTLWPLVPILGGLGLLLRGTGLALVAGLGAAVTAGLIGGAVLAGSSVPVGPCGPDESGRPFEARSGSLDAGRAPVAVTIELACGDLAVDTAQGSGWRVAGRDDSGPPPIDAGPDRLDVGGGGGGGILEGRGSWAVTLPREVPLDVSASLSAGSARLDLGGASLELLTVGVNAGEAVVDLRAATAVDRLEVQVNAGEARVDLPALALTGSIQTNVGSIRLCAPADLPIRLTWEGNIASHDFGERGLVERDGGWETPGFEAAAERASLSVEVNVGSAELRAEGSCDA